MDNTIAFNNLKNYLFELANNKSLLDEYLKEEATKKITGIKNRIENPKIKIGFWSFFSAGKSTIINNLIDKNILPSNQQTTTSIATTIGYGAEDKIEVILKNKEEFKNILAKKIKDVNNPENYNKYGTNFSRENTIKLLKTDFFGKNEKIILEKITQDLKAFSTSIKELDKKEININSIPRKYTTSNLPNNIDKDKFNEIKEEIDKINLLIDIYTNNLSIDKVKELNENSFEYSNQIKEIIITTKDWNFNKNIQILDLPGFGSSNKEHMEIAMEKLKNMNSFVFVEAETLTEGDCKLEMSKLKEEFPEIFKNSYFIKNKMSLINKDTKENFDQKMKYFDELANDMGFDKSKIFKIDALKEVDGERSEYYNEFLKFKEKLIEDSKVAILKEFILDSLNSLEDIHVNIQKNIDENINELGIKDSEFENEENLKGITLKIEINKECKEFEKNLKLVLENLNKINDIKQISESIEERLNLQDEILSMVLKNKINILNEANSKKDIHEVDFHELSEIIINNIELNELIRNKCEIIARNNFSENFYSKIKNTFNDKLLEFVPIKEKNNLNKVISKNINERLNGAIDVILFTYSEDMDLIRSKSKMIFNYIFSKNKDFKNKAEKEIELNKEMFSEFLEKPSSNLKEIINEVYNIKDDDKIVGLTKIISKHIESYLKEDVIPDIDKYMIAIINNYIKDIIKDTKQILCLDNFEAEFQQNVENKINDKVTEIIKEKKEEKEKLEKIKNNLENLKNSMLK